MLEQATQEMLRFLDDNDASECLLDDAVGDLCDNRRSQINNQGQPYQVRYILEQMGIDAGIAHIRRELGV